MPEKKPVTKRVTVTGNVTNDVVEFVTAFTPAVQPPMPGEKCQLCGERKPSEKALKQRAYRERKEG